MDSRDSPVLSKSPAALSFSTRVADFFAYIQTEGRVEMSQHATENAYQSWPTTKRAQNMVPCASQYKGQTNLHKMTAIRT